MRLQKHGQITSFFYFKVGASVTPYESNKPITQHAAAVGVESIF
jgi:hypothetical protein